MNAFVNCGLEEPSNKFLLKSYLCALLTCWYILKGLHLNRPIQRTFWINYYNLIFQIAIKDLEVKEMINMYLVDIDHLDNAVVGY